MLRRRGVFTAEQRKASHESRRNNLKQQPFEQWGSYLRRETVLKEQNFKCFECGIEDWNSKPIVLEIDHIDGNNANNKRENLRGLCPNCHSQTLTYKGRNINSGKVKVSDEILLEALQEHNNIRKALISVGLAAKGGNYQRAKKLSALFEREEVEPFKVGEAFKMVIPS